MSKENAEVTIPDNKIATVCCGYYADGVKKRCYKIFAFDRMMIKNKMEEHVPLGFKCPKCGYINCITKWIKDPNGLGNIKVTDYLGCVAYAGNLDDDAIDEINDSSKKLFVDIHGDAWSRDEYKKQNGCDPALHILRKLQGGAIIGNLKEKKDVVVADGKVPAICCGIKDNGEEKKSCHKIIVFDRRNMPNSFQCPECKSINGVMGLVKTPNGIGNIKTENYLECIAYTGTMCKDPIGVINDGSKKLYVDINGKQWSRDEYIEKYGRDPALHILERIELQKQDDIINEDIDKRRER
jgi:transcription elongation factor Elf1